LVIQDCGYVKGIKILFHRRLPVMLVFFYMMYSVCILKEKFTLIRKDLTPPIDIGLKITFIIRSS
jgi:hypothetical protein